jgi:PAS domain S-box-containing protein
MISASAEYLPDRLKDLCRRLSEADDLRSGVEAVAWACDGVFSFYRVSLAFPARRPNRYYVAAAWARKAEEELEGYDFSLRGHPLERTTRDGVTVVRTDPMQDNEDAVLSRLFRDEKKAEEMAVPVALGGKRGVLVFSSRNKGTFGAHARRWAEDVGRTVGPWARAWAGPDAPHALREQYEALLDGALDGIAVLRGGRIVYANTSFHEIFGIAPDQNLTGGFQDLLQPESRPAFLDSLGELDLRPRVLPRLEVEAATAGGRQVHLDLGLQRIIFQGEPATLIQVHNSTERAEREREVRESSARTDALLLTLAHDIRGPLTTVIGFSELLLQRFPEMSADKVSEIVGVLCRVGNSLKKLVEGLLEYSSLSARQAPVVDVTLEPLLASVERELEGLLRESETRIDYSRIPPVVGGRSMELGRVFRNLIENAVKYADRDRSSRVRVSCVGEEGSFYVFCVEDNGVGIKPEQAQRIFDLFQRGDGGGAGVGLAIVDRIVRGHGGRVWVDSHPGAGSRFYFTLPRPSSHDP